MTSLISKLNALQNLSPDQIAQRLNNKGWRKPSQLGESFFNDNKDIREYHYWQVRRDGSSGMVNRVGTWAFANCDPNYRRFCTVLETDNHTYWVIHQSEFTGEPPPCSTS